jgi:hypothetical protein
VSVGANDDSLSAAQDAGEIAELQGLLRAQAGVLAGLKMELALLRVKGPAPPPASTHNLASSVLQPTENFGLTVTGLSSAGGGGGGGVAGAVAAVQMARELHPLAHASSGSLIAAAMGRGPQPLRMSRDLVEAHAAASARMRASGAGEGKGVGGLAMTAVKAPISPARRTEKAAVSSPARK